MATVTLENIFKSFGNTEVVKGINMEIEDGEFVVLVGPSGCGKTTTLRMVAGLESITKGNLYIGDEIVNDKAPKDRDIAMVFQNYALYAHMTVYNNIAFGLKLRKVPKQELRSRVEEAARAVGMTEYLNRKPKELSGGQRQRVALARAIVRQPGVYLFDEPLSNLDAKLRVQMRMEIARLQRTLGTTTIYVTHDQVEAMTMADRIAVMHNGVLQQFGEPMELYHKPANIFVAGFIGSPSMNFITGRSNAEGVFSNKAGTVTFNLTHADLSKKELTIGIRPEGIHLDNVPGSSNVKGTVLTVELMGSESIVYFDCGGSEYIARIASMVGLEPGSEVNFHFDTSRLHYFDSPTGNRIKVS